MIVKRHRWFLLLLLCICIIPGGIVYAQVKDSAKVLTLEEVTVRYRNLVSGKSITPAQTLKGAALQNMNSLSVADAVRYFSGVQMKDYGGIGGLKTIDTRSMGSNHTGVFYDGIQLGNAQNGQVDLGKFSLDNLGEVTLYNAHKTDLLQPARSFGAAATIHLQSRVPVFDVGEKSHAKASIKTGSFGLFNPSALWEQKISNRIYASVGGEWIKATGKYKFRYTNGVYDTSAKRQNADINAWRLEAGLYALFQDSSRWNLKLYHYKSERGLPGAIVANKFEHGQRQWDKNFFVQSSFKSDLRKRYNYMFNVKYAQDYLRYLDPDFVTTQGFLDNRYTQKELYLSFSNSYAIKPWWQLALSTDGHWNNLSANLYHFAYPSRYTLLASLASHLQFKRFSLQAGLLETVIWEKTEYYQGAGNKQQLTPFISASWQPFSAKNFRFRAFYKNIFRMPTFNDLYYTFIGNTNLRPEFTNQYDIGFSWAKQFPGTLQFIVLQADAYYNEVADKIVAVPTTNLYRWMMLNLGKVEVKGIDVSAETSWSITDNFALNTTMKYTYQQSVDVTPGAANYKHQIPYVPNHNGSLILNARWENYNLNYSFIYTGERYSQKMNIPVNYLQPWYTHDVSIAKLFRFGKRNARLMLEVNNLFNQYYDVIINYPMPGRYFRLSGSINF